MSYTIVASDIHGDLNQLMHPLMLFLSDPSKYQLVLLGDYIDRGESNVYIYEIIRAIYKHPNVHVLFGNHELYDKGTIDYFSYQSPFRMNGNSFIKTFVYDLFNSLDLGITYYDHESNILYSHSPLNRPMSVIQKLPKTVESTFTYDRDSPNMKYKNIHGHDHRRSSKMALYEFFKTNDVNMISIDNDASYGIKLMMNAMTVTCNNWTSNVVSDVYYLVINNSDIRKYDVKTETIKYGSKEDFNHVPFEYIKKKLMKACVNDRERNVIDSMSLQASWKAFKSRGIGLTSLPGNVKKIYSTIIEVESDTQRANVYYHDLPFEFYQFALNESKSKDNKLKQICGHQYIPVHDLYWKHVLDDPNHEFVYGLHGTHMKESMSGGFTSNTYQTLGMVLLVLTVSITFVIIIGMCINKNVGSTAIPVNGTEK